MKLDHIIAQHLYTTKELSLQGVGNFSFSSDFIMPDNVDKDFVMPNNAISFNYNAKATEDEALISTIVKQTKKIKPLAAADLDSFIALGKQFLNIGKPFKIEGIGTLEKLQSGQYEFSQTVLHAPKAEVASTPVSTNESRSDAISFSTAAKKTNSSKKIILVSGMVATVAALAFAGWYFFSRENSTNNNNVEVVKNDSPKPNSTVTDTTRKDTTSVSINPAPKKINDSFNFKVVIKEYPSFDLANKSYNKLTSYGHKLVLYTKDSVTYKVAMPFTKPLTDTTMARDSIRKFLFGGKPYIETN